MVAELLIEAHERGLTDQEIETLTTVSTSTFHRWKGGKLGVNGPNPEKVRAFFVGLGKDPAVAYEALGWTVAGETQVASEPEIPAHVRELLRRLRDPNVDDREKDFITETLKSLVARRLIRPPR